MDFLNELFDVYRKANKIKFKEPEQMSNQTAKFGDIIEIYTNGELLIAVAISSSQALLMSEFVEFATNTDFIVRMQHPIAENWMIQIDKRLHLTPKTKYNICYTLDENSKAILKDIIIKGKSVPAEKSGPKTPPNHKDPRYKFKRAELEKTLLINKHLFYEEVEEEEGT